MFRSPFEAILWTQIRFLPKKMLFFDLAADIAISMSNENEFRSAFEYIKIIPPSIVPTQPNEVFAQLSLR